MNKKQFNLSRRELVLSLLCVAVSAMLITTIVMIPYLYERSYDSNSVMYSSVKIESGSNEYPTEGSGFIAQGDGGVIIIITNAHVVVNALGEPESNINIIFFNSVERHVANLETLDENLDIAILTLYEPADVRPLNFTNSDNLSYGDRVTAIGNSAGLGLSISSGVVSIPSTIVKYKGIEREMIQTDINLNHGGSGGPLIDDNGDVVGMMTLRYTGINQSVQSISYAIPSNIIKQYISDNT